MVWSMRRKTTNRAPRRPGSQWDLRRPQPRPFITGTTFGFYSPIAGRVNAGRAGSGPLRLLGSPMEVSVAEPQRWEQQTSMQAISILSFSFFPFPNRFGDILVSNLNMGIDYQIRRMWMLFGSICIFSNVSWLDLHNKTRVVLANLWWNVCKNHNENQTLNPWFGYHYWKCMYVGFLTGCISPPQLYPMLSVE